MINILIFLIQFLLYCNCYEITRLNNIKTLVGESPFWDAEKNSIVYVDVAAPFVGKPHLFRYDLATNMTKSAIIEDITDKNTRFGFIVPFEKSKDLYAVGSSLDFRVVQWDGISTTARTLCKPFKLDSVESNFVHMGHVDPRGEFYCETLRLDMCNPNVTLPPGSIFRSKGGKNIEVAVGNMNIPNDFVFDDEKNILYYIDSCKATINAQDYNPETGVLSNERVIYDNKESPDEIVLKGPDGLALDTEGNIWASGNGEKTVYQINPNTGKRLRTIPFPAQFVQSLTFGGPDLDALYLATSSIVYNVQTGKIIDTEVPEEEGYLYKITGLGVKGRPVKKISQRYAACAIKPGKGVESTPSTTTDSTKLGFIGRVKKIVTKIKEVATNVKDFIHRN